MEVIRLLEDVHLPEANLSYLIPDRYGVIQVMEELSSDSVQDLGIIWLEPIFGNLKILIEISIMIILEVTLAYLLMADIAKVVQKNSQKEGKTKGKAQKNNQNEMKRRKTKD